jgi:hypothetical protein
MRSLSLTPFLFAPARWAALIAAGWLAPTSVSAQGSLTPPGIPAPTMRSLDQIEPRTPINATTTPGNGGALFIISTAGSYYLTGNVTGVASKAGIAITVNDVTIDLGGFTMTGVALATSAIAFSNLDRIHIRNGRVQSWPAAGLNGIGGDGARLDNVVCEANGAQGAQLGMNAVVTHSFFRNNTGANGSGLQVDNGSVVTHCTSRGNALHGFAIGNDCEVSDCTALSNGGNGFNFFSACRLQGCTATSNTGAGFSGLSLAPIIVHCMARTNTGAGFEVGSDAIITQCTSHQNAHGFTCGSGTMITGCVSSTNTPGSSASTAGAGFRVTGATARLEGNTSRGNNRGYETTVTSVLLIRNLADTNTTNYSLTGTGSGALVTAANVATSTNPHANFDF